MQLGPVRHQPAAGSRRPRAEFPNQRFVTAIQTASRLINYKPVNKALANSPKPRGWRAEFIVDIILSNDLAAASEPTSGELAVPAFGFRPNLFPLQGPVGARAQAISQNAEFHEIADSLIADFAWLSCP